MRVVGVSKDLMHKLSCKHILLQEISVKVIIKYLLASKIEELQLEENKPIIKNN